MSKIKTNWWQKLYDGDSETTECLIFLVALEKWEKIRKT